MKKNAKDIIGIIGLGRFGMALAKELCQNGQEIVACDTNESKVKELLQYTDNVFLCEDSSEDTLTSMGIDKCSMVVVCIGEDIAKSILTTLTIINLGVPKVLSKAINESQGLILEKLGAKVVYPERDMAIRTAKKILNSNVMEFLSLNEHIEINELVVPAEMIGKSIIDSKLRQKFGLNIIAIDHDGTIFTDIDPNYELKPNDKIVVIGDKEKIEEVRDDR